MDAAFKLFQGIYAGIKFALGWNKTKLTDFKKYILLVLTIILLTSLSLGFFALYIISLIVDIYLWIKYGKKYEGLVRGLDFIMEATQKPMAINVLTIVKKDKNAPYQEFENTIKQQLKNIHNNCCKLRCELHSIFSYKYYLNTNVKSEDIIVVMNNEKNLNRSNFSDYLNNHFMNCDLVLGNKAWKAFILKTPIKWSKDYIGEEYAILCMFRHSIGDGIPVFSLVAHSVDGLELLSIGEKLKSNPISSKATSLDDAYIYDNPFKKYKAFESSTIENYSYYDAEDTIHYIPKIKAIKSKLKIGFSDVIVGCLTAALVDYATKINVDVDQMKLQTMLRPLTRETIDILNGNFNYDKISNKMIALYTKSPAKINSKSLIEIVEECHKEGRELLGSSNVTLIFSLVNVSHLVGNTISRYLYKKITSYDLGISNVIGLQSAYICQHEVSVLIPFVTDSSEPGFMILVSSIKDKMNLCFMGPKSVLKESCDLQHILLNMFKKIDDLHHETDCLT